MKDRVGGKSSASLAAALAALLGAGSPGVGQEAVPGWFATANGDGESSRRWHADAAAFALGEGESLAIGLPADSFRVEFHADVRIPRPGKYGFHVEVEGGGAALQVAVGGGAAPTDREAAARAGEGKLTLAPLELAPGTVRIDVAFTRSGTAQARLRTSWEMLPEPGRSGFTLEPIPASATRVPEEASGDVARYLQELRGRVALTELGCVNCHAASGNVTAAVERRPPITLTRVAARAQPDWLREWLTGSQKMKPGCGMPELLDAGRDAAEMEALVELLDSLARDPAGDPAPPFADAALDPGFVARGRGLFHEIGCVACHGPFEAPPAAFGDPSLSNSLPADPPPVAFGALRGKWRVGELAQFLKDPVAVRTHGRMPSFGLDDGAAKALAHYLVSHFDGELREVAAVPRKVADAARVELGRRVFEQRGCAACHTLGDAGEPLRAPANARPLDQLPAEARGCLAPDGAARGNAPQYRFTDAQRAELLAGLAALKRSAGGSAPLDRGAREFLAFRCDACHERDGRGGVPEAWSPFFHSVAETDLGDEGRLPPRLTGVGGRLRSPWLEKVVGEGARARPYLAARMPSFGGELASRLATFFAASEGEWRSAPPEASPSATDALAGRKLAGSGGFNCITCHSFGTRPSAGTPGLDFLQFAERLRPEWWRRYARAPNRFKSGTRMPTYFDLEKSQVTEVLGGEIGPQLDALFAWFEQAAAMPAPEGVPTGERMILDVGDRPVVFRTFLARAGNRGIAVGTPSGLHFAFDAEQIRLVEAWRGEFLDVAPVWTGRGGQMAGQPGPIVWSAPPGPAILRAPVDENSENGENGENGANGGGDWPADTGRAHGVKFRGYRLEADGSPTLLYELRDPQVPADAPPQPGAVTIEERFVPSSRAGVLFERTFRVEGLAKGESVALRLGALAAAPRISHGEGKELTTVAGGGVLRVTATEAGRPVEIVAEVRP